MLFRSFRQAVLSSPTPGALHGLSLPRPRAKTFSKRRSVAEHGVLPATALSAAVMAAASTASNNGSPPPLPVAKKVRHELELFGDVRVDNYYWLRDDSRSNPEVLSYLQQENAYTEYAMAGTLSIVYLFLAIRKSRRKVIMFYRLRELMDLI